MEICEKEVDQPNVSQNLAILVSNLWNQTKWNQTKQNNPNAKFKHQKLFLML